MSAAAADSPRDRLLAERLAPVLARALGDDCVDVRELRRLTGGANCETWALRAESSVAGSRELILRLPMDEGEARFATEAAALRAAARHGVPSPEVLAHDAGPSELGSPYLLMELVPGETLPRRILRDHADPIAARRLTADCGRILAALHRVPPAEIPGLDDVDPMSILRDGLDAFDEALPALELGYRWLDAHRPEDVSHTLVHGDFRNGNLIVDETGVRAVLDWEMTRIGDPRHDLGYLCARVWRFGGPGAVGGFGDRETLFAAYESAGGLPLDPVAVSWWELWATIWWGNGCVRMGARHLAGVRRSVELAAVGRRAWEQEYDVMLLLGELERGR